MRSATVFFGRLPLLLLLLDEVLDMYSGSVVECALALIEVGVNAIVDGLCRNSREAHNAVDG